MPKLYSVPVDKFTIEDTGNDDFLKLDLYMISTGINCNGSEFLYEGFEQSIPSVYNKPILAYFNRLTEDTEEHNSRVGYDPDGSVYYDYEYEGAERPVGLIPESAIITVEKSGGKDWVVVHGAYIWTEYNHNLANIIRSHGTKKISVEIEGIGSWVENGIEKIPRWNFLGVTILGCDKYGKPYKEGIEGAHLRVREYSHSADFNNYKSRFSFAMSTDYSSNTLEKYGIELNNKSDFISKKEWGTDKSIPVDKSKESVSFDSWGDISKSELRNIVLKAKNYKTLVKSVYLKVEDGWEESPSSHLKYPVMQYKDKKFVYNANGLLSAQQYGEKNDKAVARKALSIRKKLDLDRPEKEEHMKKFVEAAKDSGYMFIGISGENMIFAKECECDMLDKQEMAANDITLFEIPKTAVLSFEDSGEFAWDEITGISIDLTNRDDGWKSEYDADKAQDASDAKTDDAKDDDDDEDDDDDRHEMAARIEHLEMANADLVRRCEKAEHELEQIRMEQFKEDTDAIMADEIADMDEKTHEELCAMRDAGKFANVEEFVREIAYRKYAASKSNGDKTKSLTFALNTSVQGKADKKPSLYEKLSNI